MQKTDLIRSDALEWCENANYSDLLLHNGLFKKGLLVITHRKCSQADTDSINESRLKIKDRILQFENIPQNPTSHIKKSLQLLAVLCPGVSPKVAIRNLKRHDEIYFNVPLVSGSKKWGYYLHPWVQQKKIQDSFQGFHRFVTCVCLFGSSLTATDEKMRTFTFIQYDFNPAKIVKLNLENSHNIYEQVWLFELNRMALFIKQNTIKNGKPNVLFHLPYYDYLIFGIHLYLRGILDSLLLNEFTQWVLAKATEYEKSIVETLRQYGIEVSIQSPFDNLFGSRTDLDAGKVLKLLDLSDYFPGTRCIDPCIAETILVKKCRELLTADNRLFPQQRDVWLDYFQEKDKVDIKSLLKLSNAVMLGIATRGDCNDKVCSFLPLSEKQIQIKHSKIKPQGFSKYGQIFYLTFIDPVLAYSDTSNGSLFYFAQSQQALKKWLMDDGILEKSYTNIPKASESEEENKSSNRPAML